MAQVRTETCDIRVPPIGLAGTLHVPRDAYALVVFAHGSGSSRLSPRNRMVADALNDRRIATLLFDLLTSDEEADRANVFDIPLLADRLVGASAAWMPSRLSQRCLLECSAPALGLRLHLLSPRSILGARHLFLEPAALEAVIDHAARWFEQHLAPGSATSTPAVEIESKGRGS